MKVVLFTKPFDWRERHDFLIAYSAGSEVEVADDCAAYAVARGCAVYSDFAEEQLLDRSNGIAEDDQVRAIIATAHDAAVEDAEDER